MLFNYVFSSLITFKQAWIEFLCITVILTFLLLLFGEIMPKVYSRQNPLNFCRNHVGSLMFFRSIFWPLENILIRSGSIAEKVVQKESRQLSVDDLEQALELTDKEELKGEQSMLQGIIRFGDETAKEIMTSRQDIVDLDIKASFSEVLRCIVENNYSRIPVYQDSEDNMRGILYIKDLLPHLSKSASFRWQSLIRPPYFVPETKKIDDLLRDFQENKVHIAIVVDEFGGTSGIVTMEDILEDKRALRYEPEYYQDMKKIAELKAILADEKLLLAVIRDEMNVIADKFGDDRRSRIEMDASEFVAEDLIPNENTVIARTSLGYIKRMTDDNFRAQNRGGRGIKGINVLDNDYIEDLLMTRTHDTIMFFTSLGRVYSMKAYKIPEASRISRGTAIINLLELSPDEKITAIIPIMEKGDDTNLFMVTRKGIVKKTPLKEYSNIRRSGIIAIGLREDDELIEVKQTNADSEIFLVTRKGMCIRFKETDVRPTGRTAMGVIGMDLNEDDEIVGMQLNTQGDSLLIASANGMGKRTDLEEFRIQNRGGKGIKCYKITKKTGNLIGVKAVTDQHEIMMISTDGIIIQLRASEFKNIGRIASGVKMMNLNEGAQVVQIAKVRDAVEQDSPAPDQDTQE